MSSWSRRRYIDGEPEFEPLLASVLAHRDVCSREPLYVRYDGVVRGTTVVPRGSANAGVIAPLYGSPLGVALGVAGNPRYGKIDPPLAAQYAVLESVRKVVAVGARPLGLTDCLNFGNPQNVEHYSELVHCIDGLAIAATELGTPYVSGNVSLYNESKTGNAVPASPIVACAGGLADVGRVVTAAFHRPGSPLYFIGSPHNAMGGAVAAELLGQTGGPLAPIDYAATRRQIAFMLDAAQRGAILSAYAIGNGGMLAAAAKMSFASGNCIGASFLFPVRTGVGRFEFYFAESCGWLVEAAEELTLPDAVHVGMTNGPDYEGGVEIRADGNVFDIDDLYAAWSAPLAQVYP